MSWSREKDGPWIDWSRENYRVEQGRDAYESRHGRPYLLLRVVGARHERVAAFATLSEAQTHAEASP